MDSNKHINNLKKAYKVLMTFVTIEKRMPAKHSTNHKGHDHTNNGRLIRLMERPGITLVVMIVYYWKNASCQ